MIVASVENNSPVSRIAVFYNAGPRFEGSDSGITHAVRSAASLVSLFIICHNTNLAKCIYRASICPLDFVKKNCHLMWFFKSYCDMINLTKSMQSVTNSPREVYCQYTCTYHICQWTNEIVTICCMCINIYDTSALVPLFNIIPGVFKLWKYFALTYTTMCLTVVMPIQFRLVIWHQKCTIRKLCFQGIMLRNLGKTLIIMIKSMWAPVTDKHGFRSMFILLDYRQFLMLIHCIWIE